jgi:mRNA interferase RelE/StbE
VEIRFSKAAQKALLKSNKRGLIRDKIAELASDPDRLNPNVIKLVGRPECRLRVQDWRIIFRVEASIIWIDHIGPRGSVYED